MAKRIYLDNSASTPVEREVFFAMRPYFLKKYGNASSVHSFGREVQDAIDNARLEVAKFLNASLEEILFTSSATEASNMALVGTIRKFIKNGKKPHIIVSAIEHESILETASYFHKIGQIELSYAPVNKDGILILDEFKRLLRKDTALVSVMHANNEVGTIQPIDEVSKIIKSFNQENKTDVLFHTDSAQSANFLDCNVKRLGVDMMTLSGHKIYGPKGVGVLFLKEGVKIEPFLLGSKQEKGLRSGTENAPAIVGMGKAVSLVKQKLPLNKKIKELRDFLLESLLNSIDNAYVNGSLKRRVEHNLNISFLGVKNSDLIKLLDLNGVAVSAGAACYSKSLKQSHVLRAMGLSEDRIDSAIRISLGRTTTKSDIKRAVKIIKESVTKLRR